MLSYMLRYGIVSGLIVATPMVWRMLAAKPGATEEPVSGMLLGYLTMIVALTAVFLGVKAYRDKVLGGAIRFLPGTGPGSRHQRRGVRALCHRLGNLDRLQQLRLHRVLQELHGGSARAHGASGPELNQAIADADAFAKMYVNPLYRLPMTFIEMFPVGVLISLITAAILRNRRVLPARA